MHFTVRDLLGSFGYRCAGSNSSVRLPAGSSTRICGPPRARDDVASKRRPRAPQHLDLDIEVGSRAAECDSSLPAAERGRPLSVVLLRPHPTRSTAAEAGLAPARRTPRQFGPGRRIHSARCRTRPLASRRPRCSEHRLFRSHCRPPRAVGCIEERRAPAVAPMRWRRRRPRYWTKLPPARQPTSGTGGRPRHVAATQEICAGLVPENAPKSRIMWD